MLLWEVPRSCSEGEAAIILLSHFIDTNSLAIRQPNNECPKWKNRHSEPLRNGLPQLSLATTGKLIAHSGAPGERDMLADKKLWALQEHQVLSLC